MLGIEDYGSDVESGDESQKPTPKTTTDSRPTSSSSPSPSKFPPPSRATFSLPPPRSSSSSSLSLPAPVNSARQDAASVPQRQKRTKKIVINTPSFPRLEDDADDGPPAKKSRVTSSLSSSSSAGAGTSSLLSMLPAPKQPTPTIQKKQERVLGGGGGPGLVFRASKNKAKAPPGFDAAESPAFESVDADTAGVDGLGASTSFVHSSLEKGGRPNTSVDNDGVPDTSAPASAQLPKSSGPPVDFFSLGSSTSSAPPLTSTSSTPPITSAPSSSSVSSAPVISTFRPPSPTLDDPYPGYYQLPSGAYAPHDAEYYSSYAKKWKAEYDKHIRALEKSQDEPENGGAQDVDMTAEMAKARREIKEREDRKALTTGVTGQNENGEMAMPRMNVKGAKLGAVARSRHQLTTLLTEAYMNRDALEERIAQGRRNRKEAGMKYGF